MSTIANMNPSVIRQNIINVIQKVVCKLCNLLAAISKRTYVQKAVCV